MDYEQQLQGQESTAYSDMLARFKFESQPILWNFPLLGGFFSISFFFSLSLSPYLSLFASH